MTGRTAKSICGVAGHEGRIYLDLVDKKWRVVEIDAEGWKLIDNAPVRFIRRRGMKALPVPVPGGSVETLAKYLNVNRAEFVLAVTFVLAAMRPPGPYPVLVVTGEAGSAKSTLLRVLRALIDPNTTPLRGKPDNNKDVFIAANNSHLPTFDNLSELPPWLSDTLAMLATGGGFSSRELYSDDEEKLFEAARPIMLGGIENIVVRDDLADRSIYPHLKHIPEDQRQLDRVFWAAFNKDYPSILGALLDALAYGLRTLPSVRLTHLPRMADFYEFGIACEGALFEEGAFAEAYGNNRASATVDVIEADQVATAVETFLLRHRNGWDGSVTELLRLLNEQVEDAVREGKEWPKAANKLVGRLQRAATPLRKTGIMIEVYHHARTRRSMVSIMFSANNPSQSSDPSKPLDFKELGAKDTAKDTVVFNPLKNHEFEGSKDSGGSFSPPDNRGLVRHRRRRIGRR
jgi:hypothetical protein